VLNGTTKDVGNHFVEALTQHVSDSMRKEDDGFDVSTTNVEHGINSFIAGLRGHSLSPVRDDAKPYATQHALCMCDNGTFRPDLLE
jgi:hypothetical protein